MCHFLLGMILENNLFVFSNKSTKFNQNYTANSEYQWDAYSCSYCETDRTKNFSCPHSGLQKTFRQQGTEVAQYKTTPVRLWVRLTPPIKEKDVICDWNPHKKNICKYKEGWETIDTRSSAHIFIIRISCHMYQYQLYVAAT